MNPDSLRLRSRVPAALVQAGHEAWLFVLAQLQLEMSRASFDTWVRDTYAVSLEEDVLTVATCNPNARDWLESRLTSTVQRLLIGILNQSVSVQFVVADLETQEPEDKDEGQEVAIEPVQWLDYDKIVQPHKEVVVKGYLRRLGMEIDPKAIWLYIGFHQAAWMVHSNGKDSGMALHSRDVMRFSGLSFGAFWRLLRHAGIQSQLTGLVQRMDPPDSRHFRRGRDGRPHRVPIRYQVYMAPRLTRADSAAVYGRLKSLLEKGASMLNALQELLVIEDVIQLLTPIQPVKINIPMNSVMDMARWEAGEGLTPEVDHLAQELHRRIVNALGDIHITHFFLTQVIHKFGLTPAQAWLVTVSRDMAYLNWRSGERREVVTFRGGYQEMAALIGSKRFKTVQAWFNPRWGTQQRGGDLRRFMCELEMPETNDYADLRVKSMPRSFRVLLDEPLDADGSNKLGANGSIRVDANGSISQTQMEALVGANGSIMMGANGTVKSTLKHPLNTQRENTPTTQHAEAVEADAHWEFKGLLRRNNVHPKVQRELFEAQTSTQAFVSWVLYTASSEGKWISDPLGYTISRLREDPMRGAGSAFDQLAALPPKELKSFMDFSLANPLRISGVSDHPNASIWREAMGSNRPSLKTVQTILFGKGGHE